MKKEAPNPFGPGAYAFFILDNADLTSSTWNSLVRASLSASVREGLLDQKEGDSFKLLGGQEPKRDL